MPRFDDSDKVQDRNTSSADQYFVKDPESFALNLARMLEEAGKAASAWAKPRENGNLRDQVAEPMSDMVKTFSRLSEYWLADPARSLDAQTRLFSGYMNVWENAIRRMGEPEIEDAVKPERGDKRFQDEEWANNSFFDFIKQTYLVTTRWAADLVTHAEGLDDHTRHKAEFYVRQICQALSPSNFTLTNPELFRETVANNGENLVRGMKMLAEDIAVGKGDLKLRQADNSKFEIGRNIAQTPGRVIARSDIAEIIQYRPATQTVLKRPLLICPPWINKYYILDISPQKSFIRWAVEQGHSVFVISWVNPDKRHSACGWEAYIRDGVEFAMDAAEKATGESEINAVGYCVGGTLLAAALALMAREGENRVKSVTFLATQVDFTHAGDLMVFIDEEQITALERAMNERGFLKGTQMASAFNMLRANDLIWPYVINNYLRGKEPMPFDLLYWNADSTRMTATNHSFYLRNCYLENNLSQGRMQLAGHTLSLADVTIPVYCLATSDDHISPPRSVFLGSRCFGGDVEFVLGGSGHIAGVINPPSMNKYAYWTGAKPQGELDEWLGGAQEHRGSWWPHWQAWIEAKDDRRVKARRLPARAKTLGDAPGTYVKVRT